MPDFRAWKESRSGGHSGASVALILGYDLPRLTTSGRGPIVTEPLMRTPRFAEVIRLPAAHAEARSTLRVVDPRAGRRVISTDGRAGAFIVESSRLAAARRSALDRRARLQHPLHQPERRHPERDWRGRVRGRSNAGASSPPCEASGRIGGGAIRCEISFPVRSRNGRGFITIRTRRCCGTKELRLSLEMYGFPGDVFYYFNGQHYEESEVVDAFRTSCGDAGRSPSGCPAK